VVACDYVKGSVTLDSGEELHADLM
jgi:hypothetical protein